MSDKIQTVRVGSPEDYEYDVLFNDVCIGKVFKSWSRCGGNGWTYKLNGRPAQNGMTSKARKFAISSLIADFKRYGIANT